MENKKTNYLKVCVVNVNELGEVDKSSYDVVYFEEGIVRVNSLAKHLARENSFVAILNQ